MIDIETATPPAADPMAALASATLDYLNVSRAAGDAASDEAYLIAEDAAWQRLRAAIRMAAAAPEPRAPEPPKAGRPMPRALPWSRRAR